MHGFDSCFVVTTRYKARFGCVQEVSKTLLYASNLPQTIKAQSTGEAQWTP